MGIFPRYFVSIQKPICKYLAVSCGFQSCVRLFHVIDECLSIIFTDFSGHPLFCRRQEVRHNWGQMWRRQPLYKRWKRGCWDIIKEKKMLQNIGKQNPTHPLKSTTKNYSIIFPHYLSWLTSKKLIDFGCCCNKIKMLCSCEKKITRHHNYTI